MDLHLGYAPGCIGRITELHAAYYARNFDFGAAFEARVAAELAEFYLRYADGRDGLWLAIDAAVIHGAIAIDGSRYEHSGAHLRWFIVSDAWRGQGIGSRLLDAAMAFCRQSGYRNVYLRTFDQLHAARHLYEKHGFTLTRTQLGSHWGKPVNEQLFTLDDRLVV
jgi:GNAT superfamily N-acetyltransferase